VPQVRVRSLDANLGSAFRSATEYVERPFRPHRDSHPHQSGSPVVSGRIAVHSVLGTHHSVLSPPVIPSEDGGATARSESRDLAFTTFSCDKKKRGLSPAL